MALKKIVKHHQRASFTDAQADALQRELVLGGTQRKVGIKFQDSNFANLTPMVDLAAFGTLAQAITDIGAVEVTIAVTSAFTISASVTIPANISIVCLQGGYFTSSNSSVLTFLGKFNADSIHAFRGNVEVIFKAGSVKVAHGIWFGLVPLASGVTAVDYTTNMQRACNAVGKGSERLTLWLTGGTYFFDTVYIDAATGSGPLHMYADSNGGTILRPYNGTGHLFSCINTTQVTGYDFENLRFEGRNKDGTATTLYDGIYFEKTALSYLSKCYFNSFRYGANLANEATIFYIFQSTFGSANQYGLGITTSGTSVYHAIIGCWFDENYLRGVYCHGSRCIFSGCHFLDNTGEHIYFDRDASNNIVIGCDFQIGSGAFTTDTGIKNYGNYNQIKHNTFDRGWAGKAVNIAGGINGSVVGNDMLTTEYSDPIGAYYFDCLTNGYKLIGGGHAQNPQFSHDFVGNMRMRDTAQLVFGGRGPGTVIGVSNATNNYIHVPIGKDSPLVNEQVVIADDGTTAPSGLTAGSTYYVVTQDATTQYSGTANVVGNTITKHASDTLPENGDWVYIAPDGSNPPGGLTEHATYFVVGASGSTFQLSLTNGGSAIDITGAQDTSVVYQRAPRFKVSTTLGGAAIDITNSVSCSYHKLDDGDVRIGKITTNTLGTRDLVHSLNTLEASSVSAASMVLDGGLGVAKKGYFGGSVDIAGFTTIGSNGVLTLLREGIVLNRSSGAPYIDIQNGSGVSKAVIQLSGDNLNLTLTTILSLIGGDLSFATGGKGIIYQAGPKDLAGSGTPEGAVTAPVGSTYRRSDGGALTSFYVKESGTGNTGWVAK